MTSLPWNQRLQQERIRRNWRQQELAELLGTTVLTVSRWERGSHRPSAYFRVKLSALMGTSLDAVAEPAGRVVTAQAPGTPQAEALQVLSSSSSSSSSAPQERSSPSEAPMLWSVPYQRNPVFTGREDLLAQLVQALHPGNAVALSQPHTQAISGLGGIGKTQIALEYAYQHPLPITPFSGPLPRREKA